MSIETDAARALLEWKSNLEDEIVGRARKLAATEDASDTMTLEHFRAAAVPALESLLKAIQAGGPCHGNKNAA